MTSPRRRRPNPKTRRTSKSDLALSRIEDPYEISHHVELDLTIALLTPLPLPLPLHRGAKSGYEGNGGGCPEERVDASGGMYIHIHRYLATCAFQSLVFHGLNTQVAPTSLEKERRTLMAHIDHLFLSLVYDYRPCAGNTARFALLYSVVNKIKSWLPRSYPDLPNLGKRIVRRESSILYAPRIPRPTTSQASRV